MRPLPYVAIGILLGACAVSAAGRVTTQDPVKVSPQYYVVRFENDRVRVLEFHLKPGEKEAMHSHPPGVVYFLADATIRNGLPDGTSSEKSLKAGDVLWREKHDSHGRERWSCGGAGHCNRVEAVYPVDVAAELPPPTLRVQRRESRGDVAGRGRDLTNMLRPDPRVQRFRWAVSGASRAADPRPVGRHEGLGGPSRSGAQGASSIDCGELV